MSSSAAPLTDMDRRLIAQIEALRGPVKRDTAPTVERPRPAARTPSLAGSLLRTAALVAMAAALVMWTQPGRAMYDSVFDGVRLAYAVALSLLH